MVAMLKRMRQLKMLLDVRIGPGAAVMSPEVQRIHMSFAKPWNNGHFGPRKFWHHYLPRLKYHNPSVPMSVERTMNSDAPAIMTVFFGTPRAIDGLAEPTPPAVDQSSANESRTQTIDMQHKHEQEIWDELARMSQAKPYEPTDAEREELRVLEEQRRRSEQDAKLQREVVAKRKREQEILDMARKSIEAQAGP